MRHSPHLVLSLLPSRVAHRDNCHTRAINEGSDSSGRMEKFHFTTSSKELNPICLTKEYTLGQNTFEQLHFGDHFEFTKKS